EKGVVKQMEEAWSNHPFRIIPTKGKKEELKGFVPVLKVEIVKQLTDKEHGWVMEIVADINRKLDLLEGVVKMGKATISETRVLKAKDDEFVDAKNKKHTIKQ